MNERLNQLPEPTEAQQAEIDHLVDTQGMSYAEAEEHILGMGAPAVSREESRRMHPSNHVPQPRRVRHYESRYDGDTFDTVDTSTLSDEQLQVNRAGVQAVREALRRSHQATSTPAEYQQYLLEQRAANDRKRRP